MGGQAPPIDDDDSSSEGDAGKRAELNRNTQKNKVTKMSIKEQ